MLRDQRDHLITFSLRPAQSYHFLSVYTDLHGKLVDHSVL